MTLEDIIIKQKDFHLLQVKPIGQYNDKIIYTAKDNSLTTNYVLKLDFCDGVGLFYVGQKYIYNKPKQDKKYVKFKDEYIIMGDLNGKY